jgi:hypothetical protein
MVVVLALGIPYVRAITRRFDAAQRQPQLPTDITTRLERIEHAIDSMSVEVERIAEGQRFTTKLLSDRSGERASGGI